MSPYTERSRPRHPIRVVAQRTGLTPAVIRAWESRYGAIGPERSDGQQRLYSDNDVARLTLLRRVTEGGRRISQVASHPDDALARLALEDEQRPKSASAISADKVSLTADLLAQLKPSEIAAVLGRVAASVGARRLSSEVLEPVLQELSGRSRPQSDAPQEAAAAARRLLLAPRWHEALGSAPPLPTLQDVRQAVHRANQLLEDEPRVAAGHVHALLLAQEMLHRLLQRLRESADGDLFQSALVWLAGRFGRERVDRTLHRFENLWGLTQGDDTTAAESADRGTQVPSERLLELLLLLWLANRHPVFEPLRDLVDDSALEAETGYRELVASLDEFFDTHTFEARDRAVVAELRPETPRGVPTTPALHLEGLLERHRRDLGELADQVRVGLGVLREENRLPFAPPPPGAAPPPPPGPPPPKAKDAEQAPPQTWQLSREQPWMADAVLVAKHVLVWLDQLSKATKKRITRLDQVPDATLAELRARGYNALWLVGLWERSPASRQLKRDAGHPDAEASAYSVFDYHVAAKLGGQKALETLVARCAEHGITVGCDLVPNHTAIDAGWVIEHPEYFIQLEEPPYPGYSFTGDNLSSDPRVEIRLEDGYRTRTDAAVVFERRDVTTETVRYLYHGNDGTGLPWNDTAQLDYTVPATRAAMLEQIVVIAKSFRMIRFDAAMTLTRRHFQRLWYPLPGGGGAVPSRSERGITAAEFDQLMPEEFWAEVVERVAVEAPETMLVAEAFWLMEPYFVRRLGVHRVYHSAFMHALHDGRNGDLRRWVADALELEPAELLRYVNFITTPDERPAAESFGKGDRYFAAATLLATLPGLPLFGHGQAEGLLEKYGMEYARAYFAESADPAFLERHDLEVGSIVAKRGLFADPNGLRLFEVEPRAGATTDGVWVFVNGNNTTRALVMVNNAPTPARGRVARSTPIKVAWGHRTVSLREALGAAEAPTQAIDLAGTQHPLEWDRDGQLLVDLAPWQARVLLLTVAELVAPPVAADPPTKPVPPTTPVPPPKPTKARAAKRRPGQVSATPPALSPAQPATPPPAATPAKPRRKTTKRPRKPA